MFKGNVLLNASFHSIRFACRAQIRFGWNAFQFPRNDQFSLSLSLWLKPILNAWLDGFAMKMLRETRRKLIFSLEMNRSELERFLNQQ